MLEIGQVLDGRNGHYEIVGRIKVSGQGIVYKARNEKDRTPVAVKEMFSPEDIHNEIHSLRAINQLGAERHPALLALPKIIDDFPEGKSYFLVMEYVPGEDFGALIEERDKPFEIEKALKWGDQLLLALEYLHTRPEPIIHRDIKPSNLKENRNQIKLLDFGLAKTGAHTVMQGQSLSYSPPEQIENTGTDARSDLYALAATLYHLMTKVRPYDATKRKKESDPLLSADKVESSQVPAPVAEVLMKAMALDRDERYANAADMRGALTEAWEKSKASIPEPDTDKIEWIIPGAQYKQSDTMSPGTKNSAVFPREEGNKPSAHTLNRKPLILWKSPVLVLVGSILILSSVLIIYRLFLYTPDYCAMFPEPSYPTLPSPAPLPPGFSETNLSPTPPTVAAPSSDVIMAAVNQTISQMNASCSSYYGYSEGNTKQLFSELNQRWQEKAVPSLISTLVRTSDSTGRCKTAALIESYLKEPNAQSLQETMTGGLNYALSVESDSGNQMYLMSVVSASPAIEDKFQRLQPYLIKLQDAKAKAHLIGILNRLASPEQRKKLAIEMTREMSQTQSPDVAGAAADVIYNPGLSSHYQEATPHLMLAVQTAPSGVAVKIVRLLRDLKQNRGEEQKQLAALMTAMMYHRVLDNPMATEAVTTIKKNNYTEAGPSLTKLLCNTTNSSIAENAADVIKSFSFKNALPCLRQALGKVPLEIAVPISDVLAVFRDPEAIAPIRSRIEAHLHESSPSLVGLGKSLYAIQGADAVDVLIKCFEKGHLSLRTSWIDFFIENRIVKAREAVQRVLETTRDDSVRRKAQQYIDTVLR